VDKTREQIILQLKRLRETKEHQALVGHFQNADYYGKLINELEKELEKIDGTDSNKG